MDPILRRLDEIDAELGIPPERFRGELLEERDGLLERLCADYLAASPRRRAAIRRFFEGRPRLLDALEDCVVRCSHRLRSPRDVDRLRIGLAAASINDARRDDRELALALGGLAKAAEAAGIDPRAHFADVADRSSRRRTGTHPRSMRTFLRLWSGP